MSYSIQHLKETAEIIAKLSTDDCEKCVACMRADHCHPPYVRAAGSVNTIGLSRQAPWAPDRPDPHPAHLALLPVLTV